MSSDRLAKVIEIVARDLERDLDAENQLSALTTLEELGIDSLDTLALIQVIRQEIGPLDEKALPGIETLGQLAAAIE